VKNTALIVALLFFLINNGLNAQYTNIRISSPEYNNPEEVTIAVNPINPLNLVAGDPCVIFDALGNLYYGHLSNPTDGSWLDRIVVQKSVDGGKTWNDGVGVGLNGLKDQDKEWLIADMTNSQYKNNIYIAWTQFDHYGSSDPNDSTHIMFSRSTDHGETWSDPIIISDQGGNCEDGDNTVEGAVPAVGPDGEVYVAWAGPLGIMFDRSFDGGQTFGKDIFVSDQPGGWDISSWQWGIYRCNGMPVTVCDISNSPYRGTIYILWSDNRNGDYDIFIAKSTDKGQTWSEPKKVNDDDSGRVQFFGWITFDPITGAVYVVFYDRRETTGNATDVYVAKSYNGCETFVNFKISESFFVPDYHRFFGDYINIAAYNGYVHPVWMRLDSMDLSAWTTVIHDTTALTGVKDFTVPENFGIQQNYPNPFNTSTTIPFNLSTGSNVTVSIYDNKGRLIKNLINDYMHPGSHKVVWNADKQSSGIYYYKIKTDNASQTKKCIVVN